MRTGLGLLEPLWLVQDRVRETGYSHVGDPGVVRGLHLPRLNSAMLILSARQIEAGEHLYNFQLQTRPVEARGEEGGGWTDVPGATWTGSGDVFLREMLDTARIEADVRLAWILDAEHTKPMEVTALLLIDRQYAEGDVVEGQLDHAPVDQRAAAVSADPQAGYIGVEGVALGQVGEEFGLTLTAHGMTTPAWALKEGSDPLPDGLTLDDETGEITGTVEEATTATVTVTATEGEEVLERELSLAFVALVDPSQYAAALIVVFGGGASSAAPVEGDGVDMTDGTPILKTQFLAQMAWTAEGSAVTVTIEHSDDDGDEDPYTSLGETFEDVVVTAVLPGSFTFVSIPVEVATLKRYVRAVVTVTSGNGLATASVQVLAANIYNMPS